MAFARNVMITLNLTKYLNANVKKVLYMTKIAIDATLQFKIVLFCHVVIVKPVTKITLFIKMYPDLMPALQRLSLAQAMISKENVRDV